MPRISQQELESYLWGAATALRGTIDAGDYKQFIFPLLFLKRLSDVFDEEIEKSRAVNYGNNEFVDFPENHRFQIPEGSHWADIRKTTTDVGKALQAAMRSTRASESGPALRCIRGMLPGRTRTGFRMQHSRTLSNTSRRGR